jgi:hypothetical protein
MQAVRICLAAAEATVLGRVSLLERLFHCSSSD